MEETKNTKSASKPAKEKKGNKEKSLNQFIAEHKAEVKKVTWPNRQELTKETITVIVISLLVGVIIFGMDTALSFCYDKLTNIGSSSKTSTSEQTETVDLAALANSGAVQVEGGNGVVADGNAEAGEANADADKANAEAGEANAEAGEANADADKANADAGEANADAGEADANADKDANNEAE